MKKIFFIYISIFFNLFTYGEGSDYDMWIDRSHRDLPLHIYCSGQFEMSFFDQVQTRATYPVPCSVAYNEAKWGYFCIHIFQYKNILTGAKSTTYPVLCEEALEKVDSGYYCSEAYKMKSLDGKHEFTTYPKKCSEALTTAKRGFFCLEPYKLKLIPSLKEKSTYPSACSGL
jgi:hypothetical protein